MFTGLIEEVGTVTAIERGAQSARFTIGADTVDGRTSRSATASRSTAPA